MENKKFIITYEPDWCKLAKGLQTKVDAVDEDAARLYFKTYYPRARLKTIKNTGIKS